MAFKHKFSLSMIALFAAPATEALANPWDLMEGAQTIPAHNAGSVVVPSSSLFKPDDEGLRVHTNVQFFVAAKAPSVRPAVSGPPYPGLNFETPASLACIYGLTKPVSGCNPNTVAAVASGGSRAIALVDAFSAKVDGDWLTVPGPIAMRGMSAKIWIATNADMRRRNVDMARLLGPVVTKASAILIKLDEKTRTRLNIADNPMSPKELARAHRNKSLGVEFIDDEAGTPAAKGPAGLFGGAVKVSGRKRKASAESQMKATATKFERPKTSHRRGTKKATTKPNSPPSKPRTRARKRWIRED